MQLLDSQAASLEKELLVEWQGLKVKRASSARFVQERIISISYHIPLYYSIPCCIILRIIWRLAWIYAAQSSTVIAPKSKQVRDSNHILKPTSYII